MSLPLPRSQNRRNGVPRWSVGNARQSSSRLSSWLTPTSSDSTNRGFVLSTVTESTGISPTPGRKRSGSIRARYGYSGTSRVGATMTRSRLGARATPSGASTSGPVDASASCPETPTVTIAASRRGTDCAGSVAAISDWPTVPMPSDWKSGGGLPTMTSVVGHVVDGDRQPLHRRRVGDPLGGA